MPLVRLVATKIARRIPIHVPLDDLLGAGMLGLAGALTRYDPQKSSTFRAYAELRIRGEILDELRRRDTISRDARTENKRLQSTKEKLSSVLGREPTDEEIAQHLGISTESFWDKKLQTADIQ
ncbi:MAG: sigma-70 family RNA polymerase sigma factor, partial [Pseudomonadota bacterium]